MALCSLATGYIFQDVLGVVSQRRFVNMPWVAFVLGIELLALFFATVCDILAGTSFVPSDLSQSQFGTVAVKLAIYHQYPILVRFEDVLSVAAQ